MSEIISIPILELMKKTEQWLLNQGYKKNTLGVYKATWNKFRAYSSSPFYDRETAEKFLLRYFGVDANGIDQKLDMRMRHARRHMSALDEFLRTGEICRRKVRGITTIADDGFDLFFSRFLDFCREQNYSKSWLDNTISGLRIFLLATHVSHTSTPEGIDMDTINCFSEAMRSADEICMNLLLRRWPPLQKVRKPIDRAALIGNKHFHLRSDSHLHPLLVIFRNLVLKKNHAVSLDEAL